MSEPKLTLITPNGVGARTPPGQPVEEVVEVLREALKQAECGELIGVTLGVVVEHSGIVLTDYQFAARGDVFPELFLAASRVQRAVLERLDD